MTNYQTALGEIKAICSPFPDDSYIIEWDEQSDQIMVKNDCLGFSVSAKALADGVFVDQVKSLWPMLVEATNQYRADPKIREMYA